MAAQILLIGSLAGGTSTVAKFAKGLKMAVVMADDITEAVSILCERRIEMAFLSADLDQGAFFNAYNEARLNTPVVAVGGADSVQNAVMSIRLGAIEYLTTPVEEKQLAELLSGLAEPTDATGPIARDEKTTAMLALAKKFAASNATVLLRGESGTGKEVLSKFIHDNSPRKNAPFVSVNCAAIPENLLESELFGHEKGAFSGAVNKRLGKFQQADGGTLLLDEISEMDLSLQAKLLRAIQERVIDPVGATKPVSVDIRLIATTNRNLEDHVREGNFREDLYFRLNVAAIELPALRKRPADILALSDHFAQKFADQYDMGKIKIADDAKQKLTNCYWKGNVRELENTLHRAILLMTGDTLTADDIEISAMSREAAQSAQSANVQAAPPAPQPPQQPVNLGAANAYAAAQGGYQQAGITNTGGMIGRSMHEIEKEVILGTLDYCGGNRNQAANMLGISIKVLRDKIEAFDTPQPAQHIAK